MFQKLVLIIALAAQILNQLMRPLVDDAELLALGQCHTPSREAADTVLALLELHAQRLELLALWSKIGRRLEDLKWPGAS